eukprot:TRINITY_DN68134_c4_g8_i1.p1 TRINITY_DN68134_c4_g8~~TRINITY_DN68134_c4_g8_i1.p1  ORF type:complete len:100 (-),score=8.84 TRINITY_DN68134_c4_g8_i1:252-551(-)
MSMQSGAYSHSVGSNLFPELFWQQDQNPYQHFLLTTWPVRMHNANGEIVLEIVCGVSVRQRGGAFTTPTKNAKESGLWGLQHPWQTLGVCPMSQDMGMI